MNVKDILQTYNASHVENVPQDVERMIRERVFKKKSARKRVRRLFVYTAVVSAACGMLMFVQSAPIVDIARTAVSIPEALAQSFHATFDSETIRATFGLGDTTQFRHRRITLHVDDALDDGQSDAQYDLYGYHADVALTVHTDADREVAHMIDRTDGMWCDHAEENTQCVPLDTRTDELTQRVADFFVSTTDSSWIQHVHAVPVESDVNGSGVALRLTTSRQLPERGASMRTYSFPAQIVGNDMTNARSNPDALERIFINNPVAGGYEHGVPVSFASSDTDAVFVQWYNGAVYSDIYRYDRESGQITAVPFMEFERYVHDDAMRTSVLNDIDPLVFGPLQYLQRYPELWTHAEEVESVVEVNGHRTHHIRIPMDWRFRFQTRAALPEDSLQLDIWYDIDTPRIVQYSLLTQQEKRVLSTVTYEDEVSSADPQQFFSPQGWEQVLKEGHE